MKDVVVDPDQGIGLIIECYLVSWIWGSPHRITKNGTQTLLIELTFQYWEGTNYCKIKRPLIQLGSYIVISKDKYVLSIPQKHSVSAIYESTVFISAIQWYFNYLNNTDYNNKTVKKDNQDSFKSFILFYSWTLYN